METSIDKNPQPRFTQTRKVARKLITAGAAGAAIVTFPLLADRAGAAPVVKENTTVSVPGNETVNPVDSTTTSTTETTTSTTIPEVTTTTLPETTTTTTQPDAPPTKVEKNPDNPHKPVSIVNDGGLYGGVQISSAENISAPNPQENKTMPDTGIPLTLGVIGLAATVAGAAGSKANNNDPQNLGAGGETH
ncbi:MAG TPA: hypothetical protein VLF90_02495 [Patescibacteria group bacterium]|nr:hypothetical protein [Patescibacteria group bacterium]